MAKRRPKPLERWSIYVLLCGDGTLYVGIAKEISKRLAAHSAGRGARYTSTRGPLRLLYAEPCPDVGSALRREREIKRWSRPRKIERLGLDIAGAT